MASLSDFIAQQVKSAAGGIEIPSNVKNQVLGGLSDSILGSLTQTATKAGGVDIIKNLFTGKADGANLRPDFVASIYRRRCRHQ